MKNIIAGGAKTLLFSKYSKIVEKYFCSMKKNDYFCTQIAAMRRVASLKEIVIP